jgi:multiple sugar transport system permease protein
MDEERNNWKAWLYLSPVLLLMALFTFYPILNTFVVSFLKDYNSTEGTSSGFSFFNYGYVLGISANNDAGIVNNDFFSWTAPSAFSNTMFITIVTVPISVLIALLIALAINSIKCLKGFFQTVFFMPYVTNVIAIGMVFGVLFSNNGVFNSIFGITKPWLDSGHATWGSCMFVICLYIIWTALPYKILIFLSGLQSIDQQYFDAARVDGAGKLKTSLKITIPLLSPQILYITVTSFISGFKEYASIVGLLNRSYSSDAGTHDLYTIVYYIMDIMNGAHGDSSQTSQFACAAAMILFLVILIFTVIELRISKKRVVY